MGAVQPIPHPADAPTSTDRWRGRFLLVARRVGGLRSVTGSAADLERDATKRLTGRAEIDDAYLGGERHGGKRGRGAPRKTPFIAAVDRSVACLLRRSLLSIPSVAAGGGLKGQDLQWAAPRTTMIVGATDR